MSEENKKPEAGELSLNELDNVAGGSIAANAAAGAAAGAGATEGAPEPSNPPNAPYHRPPKFWV